MRSLAPKASPSPDQFPPRADGVYGILPPMPQSNIEVQSANPKAMHEGSGRRFDGNMTGDAGHILRDLTKIDKHFMSREFKIQQCSFISDQG